MSVPAAKLDSACFTRIGFLRMNRLSHCVACGSRSWSVAEVRNGYELAVCSDCGLLFTVNPDYKPERYLAAYEGKAGEAALPDECAYVYEGPQLRLELEGRAFFCPPPLRARPRARRGPPTARPTTTCSGHRPPWSGSLANSATPKSPCKYPNPSATNKWPVAAWSSHGLSAFARAQLPAPPQPLPRNARPPQLPAVGPWPLP